MRAEPGDAKVLLKAVEEMEDEANHATRLVTFRSDRPDAIRSLRLRLVPSTDELRSFCLSTESRTLTIEFTKAGIAEITAALQAWIMGGEDFCVFPRGKKFELGERDRVSGEWWFWREMLP